MIRLVIDPYEFVFLADVFGGYTDDDHEEYFLFSKDEYNTPQITGAHSEEFKSWSDEVLAAFQLPVLRIGDDGDIRPPKSDPIWTYETPFETTWEDSDDIFSLSEI